MNSLSGGGRIGTTVNNMMLTKQQLHVDTLHVDGIDVAAELRAGGLTAGDGLTTTNGVIALDTATDTQLGGVKVATQAGLEVQNGQLRIAPATPASGVLGGVKIRDATSGAGNDQFDLTANHELRLKEATADRLGGFKVGDGVHMTGSASRKLSVKPATDQALGGVMVGNGLSVSNTGTGEISVTNPIVQATDGGNAIANTIVADQFHLSNTSRWVQVVNSSGVVANGESTLHGVTFDVQASEIILLRAGLGSTSPAHECNVYLRRDVVQGNYNTSGSVSGQNLSQNDGFTGTHNYHVRSDNRLKHHEVALSNTLPIIRQLVPKRYKKTPCYFHEPDYDGPIDVPWHWEAGLIAQEVLQIPEVSWTVKGGDYVDEDGNTVQEGYSLGYNNILMYALQAVKELDATVQELQARVTALGG